VKYLTQEDASAIAHKLKAERIPDARGHERVRFWYNGKIIFQFGIRRGSKELPHSFIPFQMKISQKDCRLFRACNISLEAYIEILKSKGFITQ
jgi:hypothetical protein